jgi:hypothetical protein
MRTLSAVTPDRRMDLIEAFAYPFPVTVISDMLGIPCEDRETIRGGRKTSSSPGLFRVDALGAKKARTGMPKIVETDGVGETRPLEDGLEGG